MYKSRIISYIRTKVEYADKRSKDVFLNILGMFFLKGASIFVGLLLVPMTIRYVDVEDYGIWLTISSVVAWVGFFDIGINNGFRNKFAEARAKDDDLLARKYVSTTYGLLFLIFVPLILLFLLINPFIDWGRIFNLTQEIATQLQTVMAIVFAHFGLKFILSTVNVVFLADQKPVMQSLSLFCEQLLSLGAIFLVTQFSTGSLLNLSIALCVPPIVVLTIVSIVAFANKYKSFRPQMKMIDFSLNRQLFGLGFQFFVIQVAGLIMYQTSSYILMISFGSKEVVEYNIALKYFGVILMISNILTTPIWSAVTEAKEKNDYAWIFNICKKYLVINFLLILGGILMLVGSDFVYDFWIGKDVVSINFALSLSLLVYVVSFSFGNVFVNILNGLSVLRVQFIACIFSPVVFLLSCYLFIQVFNLGVVSVVLAMIIANFNGIILAPIQLLILKRGCRCE